MWTCLGTGAFSRGSGQLHSLPAGWSHHLALWVEDTAQATQQPCVSGTALAQDDIKQCPSPYALRSHPWPTLCSISCAGPSCSPWAGAELPMSPSTVSMPQSTRMHRQQPREGCDACYPLSLATFLPFLCFLGCSNCTTLGFLHSSGFQESRKRSGRVLLPGAVCHLWFVVWGKTKQCPGGKSLLYQHQKASATLCLVWGWPRGPQQHGGCVPAAPQLLCPQAEQCGSRGRGWMGSTRAAAILTMEITINTIKDVQHSRGLG